MEEAIGPLSYDATTDTCDPINFFNIIDPGKNATVDSSAALSSIGFGFYSQYGTPDYEPVNARY